MANEDLTGNKYIDDLVATNPVGNADPMSIVDDQIRGIKNVLQKTFPNNTSPITASDADLNAVTNFEETVSATTSEVTIATAKTLNITDVAGLKISGTAVTSTATELNLLDGAVLKHKTVDIGDWNMDTLATVTVAHGLTLANIRSITTLIRADDDASYLDFHTRNGSESTSPTNMYADATNINLTRPTSGAFDSTSYDSTSFNRGWITIWYIG